MEINEKEYQLLKLQAEFGALSIQAEQLQQAMVQNTQRRQAIYDEIQKLQQEQKETPEEVKINDYTK